MGYISSDLLLVRSFKGPLEPELASSRSLDLCFHVILLLRAGGQSFPAVMPPEAQSPWRCWNPHWASGLGLSKQERAKQLPVSGRTQRISQTPFGRILCEASRALTALHHCSLPKGALTATMSPSPGSSGHPFSSHSASRVPKELPSTLGFKLLSLNSKLWFEQLELGGGTGVREDRKYTQILLLQALIHSDSYKKSTLWLQSLHMSA